MTPEEQYTAGTFMFTLWWACRERPFFAASQTIVVCERGEAEALARVLNTVPDGPFLHADDGCCYIALWELRP